MQVLASSGQLPAQQVVASSVLLQAAVVTSSVQLPVVGPASSELQAVEAPAAAGPASSEQRRAVAELSSEPQRAAVAAASSVVLPAVEELHSVPAVVVWRSAPCTSTFYMQPPAERRQGPAAPWTSRRRSAASSSIGKLAICFPVGRNESTSRLVNLKPVQRRYCNSTQTSLPTWPR